MGNYTCLCDSGSTISCINASDRLTSLCIQSSNRNPIGANGLKIKTLGDIPAQIEINGILYDILLTIIPNLCYDIIIGTDMLNKIGFVIDGTKLVIAGQEISRVFETEISSITTSTTSDQVNAKLLSISQMIECDGNQQNYQQGSAQNPVIDQHQRIANIPIHTYVTDATATTATSTVEHNRMYQPTEPTMLKTPNTENTCTRTEELGSECSYMATIMSGCLLSSMTSDEAQDTTMNHTDLDTIETQIVRNLLVKYDDIFSKSDDDIGKFCATDSGPSTVTFYLKDPTKVTYCIPRRVPHGRREWLKDKLASLQKAGIIQEVTHSDGIIHISPIVIVPKKGVNKYRMAVDYRQINENLKFETMPLPNVKDCIEKLSKMKYFTALDITSAFHQLELCEKTKKLMAFCALGKRYITNRMPFGAHPCPAKFQETMMRVFKDLSEETCTVYMDDILVHSESFEDHLRHLEDVFIQIRRHGLKLSPSKCHYFQKQTEYLGFVIGDHGGKSGYSPLPRKMEGLTNTTLPKTAKEVRSFCGGLQFYNNLIPKLNLTLAPLHKGAAKIPFKMTDEMNQAFYAVKDKLQQQIMLAFPDFSLPFKLSTDASYNGAAGILSQCHNGKEEIIYTYSKSFDKVQTTWPICELECLALVWSLDKMKELLLGRPFTWVTDSLILKQMIENPPRDLSRSGRKIQRYVDFINSFQITIRHAKGDQAETQLADFFSRAPILAIRDLFRVQITKDEWIKATKNDHAFSSYEDGWKKYQDKLFMEDGIAYLISKPRCKIAVPEMLQLKVIKYYHESYTLHGGISRMIQLITSLYFWPNMYKSIKHYIRSCEKCLKSKSLPMQAGNTIAIETPSKPWEWIQIDLVTVTNKTSDRGNRYILTSICCLTNYFQMEPIPSKETIVVLNALCKIFCNTGVPKIIQSDNGKEFYSNIMQTHAKWLDVEWRFSTPYKPSTNGRIERRHADLGKLLKILDCTDGNWCEELPYITFELNSTIDKITGISPFEQFHGWSPHVPHLIRDVKMATPDEHFYDWSHQIDKRTWEENIREHQKRAFSSIYEQRKAYKDQNALSGQISPQLVPGDLVMVKLPGTGKLKPRLHGPYKVTRVNLGGSFTAEEINGSKTVRLPAHCARRMKLDEPNDNQHDDELTNESNGVPDNNVGNNGNLEDTKTRTRRKFVDYKKFF